ncbi:hypothetical protein DH2020_032261 [Rehmannia glutinosa]|uniref:Ethanolaminephosphotransferase n=1 Tax=Rehmannia glutinosa TaxID=99300 RepID=A0ABR0VFM7_REHGL
MGYIGAHGVAALHRHKYSGVDNSVLAKYVLQPFWTRCVNFFPLWMPPNMITLTGSMFLVTSALLGYIYSPQLDSPPPRWVHFAHGLLLFLYQTFDAVDGKQARRTNSSSPLGELFDHGDLSLFIILYSLASDVMLLDVRLRPWPLEALQCVVGVLSGSGLYQQSLFTVLPGNILPSKLSLLFHQYPHSSGYKWTYRRSYVDIYDTFLHSYCWYRFYHLTSLPMLMVLYYVCEYKSAARDSDIEPEWFSLSGAEWWAQQFGKSIPLLSWVPFINVLLCSVYNVHKVVQARKGSMLLALTMLYPFVVLLGGVLVWDYLSPSDLMGNYPHLIILGIGLAFGHFVGFEIPIEHNNACGLVPKSLFYLPFAIANALTARLNDGVPLVDEFWVVLGFFAYTVALYLHFATSVVHEITTALGIYCFRITRKEA